MRKIEHFKFLFVISTIIFLQTTNVFACMCGATSVCEAYSQASAIVIGKVLRIENPEISGKGFYLGKQIVLVKVEKSFKGTKEKTIKLSQENSSCDWWFEDKHIDETFLFYLSKNKEDYSVISCRRSTELAKAKDDLSWLNKLPKAANRTRISGVSQVNEGDFPFISGIKLKIYNENKSYEVKTDEDGLYEIWDVPSGKYSIIPQIPKNLELSWTTSMPDNWIYFWYPDRQDKNALNVTIEPKSCGGVDFIFKRKKDEE